MDDSAAPERLPLTSPDLAADRLARLRELLPGAFAEGKLVPQKLAELVGAASVSTTPERYGLSYTGRAEALRETLAPSHGTLRPDAAASVAWDATENLIIEGDNLHVLKLLQSAYAGTVKLIYIDPPYNTGNDFVYPDDFRAGLARYKEITQQNLTTNPETSGRYHSDWLKMMHPRLALARNLLRDDGVIFVSIDDHEVHNLRLLMDEVFGEENFVANMVWEGAFKNDARQIGTNHEYVLVYARDRDVLPREWSLSKEGVEPVLKEAARLKKEHGNDFDRASEEMAAWFRNNKATPSFALRRFRFIDKNGVYKEDDPTAPGGRKCELKHPKTGVVLPLRAGRGWAFDQDGLNSLDAQGRISYITPTTIMVRRYLHETDAITPQSVFYQPARSASERLETLLGGNYFEFPKDETVVRQFLEVSTGPGDLVLDFFAGSGTTAQAVIELNRQDGGDRKFILVQFPENTGRADFPTIADITRERVRRVIARRPADLATGAARAEGFRAYRLDDSCFKIWDGEAAPRDAEGLAQQLELMAHNVREDRADADLLAEIVLKCGHPGITLGSPVERREVAGQPVHLLAGGALAICLGRALTRELLRAVIALAPKRVLCLDVGFHGNDELKTNTVLEMKSHGIQFQTV